MKILVTGGAGFIGSHTVDALLEKEHQVKILDNLQKRVHPYGKPSYLPKKAEFIKGDVSNKKDLLKALRGVTHVFHLAAYQDYMTDFSHFIHTNTESTALLFELIVEKKLPIEKIVFASSQSVAGEGKYCCQKHGIIYPEPRPLNQLIKGDWEIRCPQCKRKMKPMLIDENVANPHTVYGISKYAIEKLAFHLGKKYNIPIVCLRYTYVQGSRNSFYNAYSGICRIFTLRLLHNLPPIVYEDGKQQRDFINVKDVVKANLLVMERDKANWQIFNVGGGKAYTVLDFAKAIIGVFGKDLKSLIPREFRLGDTRHTVCDISKLQKLGWKPTIPIEQSIREYLDWIVKQKEVKNYYKIAEKEMKKQGVIRRVEK